MKVLVYLSPSGMDIDGDGTIAGELDLDLRNINAGKVQLQVKVYRISDFPEYTGFMDKTGDVKNSLRLLKAALVFSTTNLMPRILVSK